MTKGAVGCLKGRIVAQGQCERALIVSNVEVKDSTACVAGKLFCDMFCKGRDTRMLDCYCIERFETMNEVKTRCVLFDNTEPTRMVRGIGSFVHTCIHLYVNYPTDFIVDARWYWYISFNPRSVCYNGNFDRGKEVFMKVTALRIVPSEAFILKGDEMME